MYESKPSAKYTACCNNCNVTGHIASRCPLPTVSFGIIAFYKTHEGIAKYLMACRKHTFGYSGITKGRYHSQNISYMVDEMTIAEKLQIILRESVVQSSSPLTPLQILIRASSTQWDTPEWEFPKGRRNMREKNIDAAMREFEEETGFPRCRLNIITNILPFEEIFIGSDNRAYCYKYFVAFMSGDIDELTSEQRMNGYQKIEISQIEWKTASECCQSTRPYHVEKLNIIKQVDALVSTHVCLPING